MNVFKIAAAAGLVSATMAAYSSQVSVPNTFSNGTTADADEVNANFSALETAVNDNDTRIAALEASQLGVPVDCDADGPDLDTSPSPGESADALQTAIDGAPQNGTFTAVFSGTCGPITFNRSHTQILGADRATSIILGTPGAAAVTISNTSRAVLGTMTIQGGDADFPTVEITDGSANLFDLDVDGLSTAGNGVIAKHGATVSLLNSTITGALEQQLAVYAGSSGVLLDNNSITAPSGSEAIGIGIGIGSSVASTGAGSVIDATQGDDIAIEVELGGVFTQTDDVMTINGDLEAVEASVILLEDAVVTGNIYISDNSVLTLEMDGGTALTVNGNLDLSRGGRALLDLVTFNGNIQLHTNASMTARDTVISGQVTTWFFSAFDGFETAVNGGASLNSNTQFNLSGGSSLGGTVTLGWGGNGFLDGGVADTASYVCSGGDMFSTPLGYSICGDDDQDGVINLNDACRTTGDQGNGIDGTGCPIP